MQIHDFRTAALLVFAPLFTGCATLQDDAPDGDAGDTQPTTFDYIDDRTPDDPVVEEVAEALAEGAQGDEIPTLYVGDDGVVTEVAPLEDPEEELFFTDEEEIPEALIRQISLSAGIRDFSDDVIFGRVDSEAAFGIEYAHEIKNGLGFEVGGIGSLSTENGIAANPDVTGAAAELYGGARYWFKGKRRWTPYLGAGLSAIIAGVDDDAGGQVADDQDFSLGIYAHGGVQYDVTNSLYLGVDARALFGTDLDLETVSGDADYFQVMLMLGFRL